MNKTTYTRLFIPLTIATAATAAAVVWQWSAPWGMRAALTSVKPSLQRACSETAGCRRIETRVFWNSGRSRYETAATIIVAKSMPSADRLKLEQRTRSEITNAPSLLYRANLRALVVMFDHG
ncbi:MAG: hypothetical protein M0Z99_19215 [Betaproteobacteria bacterium]|nr:hypothetical protein [Betaproteobacteria bacterium]